MLHLKFVFTKRDRTARLLNVANLLFQHPHGLTAPARVTPWLLGWGAAVEVLDPPELRESIRQIAGDMADRYLPVSAS